MSIAQHLHLGVTNILLEHNDLCTKMHSDFFSEHSGVFLDVQTQFLREIHDSHSR
jgi:hypothetical protein